MAPLLAAYAVPAVTPPVFAAMLVMLIIRPKRIDFWVLGGWNGCYHRHAQATPQPLIQLKPNPTYHAREHLLREEQRPVHVDPKDAVPLCEARLGALVVREQPGCLGVNVERGYRRRSSMVTSPILNFTGPILPFHHRHEPLLTRTVTAPSCPMTSLHACSTCSGTPICITATIVGMGFQLAGSVRLLSSSCHHRTSAPPTPTPVHVHSNPDQPNY